MALPPQRGAPNPSDKPQARKGSGASVQAMSKRSSSGKGTGASVQARKPQAASSRIALPGQSITPR